MTLFVSPKNLDISDICNMVVANPIISESFGIDVVPSGV